MTTCKPLIEDRQKFKPCAQADSETDIAKRPQGRIIEECERLKTFARIFAIYVIINFTIAQQKKRGLSTTAKLKWSSLGLSELSFGEIDTQ